VLAVAALSVSVATRLCQVAHPQTVSVRAAASQGMRQHMDRDASQFVTPVPRLIVFLQPVTWYPKFAPAGPPLPTVLFEESLYRRPPPFSPSLA
jgi:hypothetical protein